MTIESCGKLCDHLGFNYSGVEDGDQCFCGATLPNSTTSTNCTTPCNGNSSEICGGYWALQLYSVTHDISSGQSSSNTHGHAAKIVGGVIGGVVAVAVMIAFFLFYRRSRNPTDDQTEKIDITSPAVANVQPPPLPVPIDIEHASPQGWESTPSPAVHDNSIRPLSTSPPHLTAETNDTAEQRLLALQDHVTSELAHLRTQRAGGTDMANARTTGELPPPYHPV
jgi:hypothetical protein